MRRNNTNNNNTSSNNIIIIRLFLCLVYITNEKEYKHFVYLTGTRQIYGCNS
jgi:hypothetical protein